MFDTQYTFTGPHADMVDDLTRKFDEASKSSVFASNIDLYINAPLVGFLFHRKGEKKQGPNTQNIFAEQMLKHSVELTYVFRLILLLDEDSEPKKEKRLDRAFRNFGKNKADLDIVDAYALGGIEVLHEKIIENTVGVDDYVHKMFDFVETVNDLHNAQITSSNILELCRPSELMS